MTKKGYKQTKEHIQNVSKSLKGKLKGIPKSESHKEKLRQAHLGKKQSLEAIEKQRQKVIGMKMTPEQIEKNRQSHLHLFSALDRLIKNKYCSLFSVKLREQVRIRDNHMCQKCGKTQIQQNYELLCVHHIHYLKSDCYPDLITLCRSCNVIANTNRDYWESLFMNKLNERSLLFWTRNKGRI